MLAARPTKKRTKAAVPQTAVPPLVELPKRGARATATGSFPPTARPSSLYDERLVSSQKPASWTAAGGASLISSPAPASSSACEEGRTFRCSQSSSRVWHANKASWRRRWSPLEVVKAGQGFVREQPLVSFRIQYIIDCEAHGRFEHAMQKGHL